METLFPYQSLLEVGTRADMPPSKRNLFMKIYCIRHYRGFFSLDDPAERNHLIQFPFCIHHTRRLGGEHSRFCSEHVNRVWDACSHLISLDWIKVFLISLKG